MELTIQINRPTVNFKAICVHMYAFKVLQHMEAIQHKEYIYLITLILRNITSQLQCILRVSQARVQYA